ncbi:DUF928 domain-containing protein [Nostoc sp. FACHB-152]|nr:DUF928 domain-containing protein [Nostoc sp. FACHB-152]MBD2471821.1 DUF928 domain-containing protein [Nostoc sp. FACHB-145]
MVCQLADKSQNKCVAGLRQRLLPNSQLARKLKQVTKRERAVLYAEAGIESDTITTLAQRHYLEANNQELAFEWKGLSTSRDVSLNKQIAQPPLIPESLVLKPKTASNFNNRTQE